ncbi:MAG TPA: hypothetical protein VFV67_14010 [Actinophytocola sp.]|uniref:hypothetical protein n=1 Tax=Actinophytocola sp. TaxID=1872138 RepID=UPI002DB6180B|nr:hypothetical protein [Actinophytocola sp.]HEU5471762.1 hypothetical protein [Actinophytocola sp.]
MGKLAEQSTLPHTAGVLKRAVRRRARRRPAQHIRRPANPGVRRGPDGSRK